MNKNTLDFKSLATLLLLFINYAMLTAMELQSYTEFIIFSILVFPSFVYWRKMINYMLNAISVVLAMRIIVFTNNDYLLRFNDLELLTGGITNDNVRCIIGLINIVTYSVIMVLTIIGVSLETISHINKATSETEVQDVKLPNVESWLSLQSFMSAMFVTLCVKYYGSSSYIMYAIVSIIAIVITRIICKCVVYKLYLNKFFSFSKEGDTIE